MLLNDRHLRSHGKIGNCEQSKYCMTARSHNQFSDYGSWWLHIASAIDLQFYISRPQFFDFKNILVRVNGALNKATTAQTKSRDNEQRQQRLTRCWDCLKTAEIGLIYGDKLHYMLGFWIHYMLRPAIRKLKNVLPKTIQINCKKIPALHSNT